MDKNKISFFGYMISRFINKRKLPMSANAVLERRLVMHNGLAIGILNDKSRASMLVQL